MVVTKIQQIPPRQMKVLMEPTAGDMPGIFTVAWIGWLQKLVSILNGNLEAGMTITVTTAKLTTGGSNGSMTFTNGILTSEIAAS